jgi:hypothetical protein
VCAKRRRTALARGVGRLSSNPEEASQEPTASPSTAAKRVEATVSVIVSSPFSTALLVGPA